VDSRLESVDDSEVVVAVERDDPDGTVATVVFVAVVRVAATVVEEV
jgi:hypothetical protein